MKQHIINILATIIIAVTFVACSGNQDGADIHEGHDHSGEQHGMMDQTESAKEVASNICPVSGEELGSMGEPVKVTHEGHEVKLCCKDCVKQFESNPTKYLTKVTTDNEHDSHTAEAHGDHH